VAASAEVSFPSGPWVLVVGMHRSGTSAVAGVLGALGLALPAPGDLVSGRYDNPVHNESAALTDLDDTVLRVLGGSWSAPPELTEGWERTPAVTQTMRAAPGALRRAYPGPGPSVWKDPRLCLLLPWWRTLLPSPVLCIVVWRHPVAVARSLRARQGFPPSLGLALWQRYNREALGALGGQPAYVVSYEALRAEPAATMRDVAGWLATAGVTLDDSRRAVDAAAHVVTPGPAEAAGPGASPPAIETTAAALDALRGAVAAVPALTPASDPDWMVDVIEQRHQYEELYARYMRYVRLRRRIPILGHLERRRRRR